jgi:uncharacterized protein YbjQ (UPF0145 family)
MTDVKQDTIPISCMNGPEFYALLHTGYMPIGVAFGVAAQSMGARGFARTLRAFFHRGEMTALAQTEAEARLQALNRLGANGKEMGGDLILIIATNVRDLGQIIEITYTGNVLKKVGELKSMPIVAATN